MERNIVIGLLLGVILVAAAVVLLTPKEKGLEIKFVKDDVTVNLLRDSPVVWVVLVEGNEMDLVPFSSAYTYVITVMAAKGKEVKPVYVTEEGCYQGVEDNVVTDCTLRVPAVVITKGKPLLVEANGVIFIYGEENTVGRVTDFAMTRVYPDARETYERAMAALARVRRTS